MFDHSRTRFHGKKVAQDFFCTVSIVFDRVKTVALWSAKKIKIKRTIKGYGYTAMVFAASLLNTQHIE